MVANQEFYLLANLGNDFILPGLLASLTDLLFDSEVRCIGPEFKGHVARELITARQKAIQAIEPQGCPLLAKQRIWQLLAVDTAFAGDGSRARNVAQGNIGAARQVRIIVHGFRRGVISAEVAGNAGALAGL